MGNLRDIKGTPFCWQEKEIMRVIRENYMGEKRTTAIAIYQCVTEIASNNGNNAFTAYNSQVAELSGKSRSTIKIYVKQFITLGILEKNTRKFNDRINLASEWRLLSLGNNSNSTSSNNKYPRSDSNKNTTSIRDRYPTIDIIDEPDIEENKLEEINKNNWSKVSQTDAYKRAKAIADQLRRSKS